MLCNLSTEADNYVKNRCNTAFFTKNKEFPGPGIPFRSYGLADFSSTVDLNSLEYKICGSFAAHLFGDEIL